MDYDGIPTAVLFCHVCQKHMWDGAVSYSLCNFLQRQHVPKHKIMSTYYLF